MFLKTFILFFLVLIARFNCEPIGECSGRDYILLPESTDCTKYNECVGGTPKLQTCPAGFYFDAVDKVSDWFFLSFFIKN